MKKFTAMLLAVLMMCCSCTLAQEAEETVLAFDLTGYFSTGVGLGQVQPLATWEEAVAAGLPLQSDAYQSNRYEPDADQKPSNRLFELTEGTIVTFLDQRMQKASFQFVDDRFVSFDLYPEEKLTLDEIVPKISEIAGEEPEEVANALGATTVDWNFEIDGELMELSIFVGEGNTVSTIVGTYWSGLWELVGHDPN